MASVVAFVPAIEHMFELAPDYALRAYLFSNVSNGEALRDMLKPLDTTESSGGGGKSLAGTACIDGGLVAFVDVDVLAGPLTLLAAANKAVVSHVEGTRKTESLATECLYNLSASKSINFALKTFGSNARTTRVAAVIFEHRQGAASAQGEEKVLSAVQGSAVAPDAGKWAASPTSLAPMVIRIGPAATSCASRRRRAHSWKPRRRATMTRVSRTVAFPPQPQQRRRATAR